MCIGKKMKNISVYAFMCLESFWKDTREKFQQRLPVGREKWMDRK